ncbi:MATE family efflux transporter [Thalassotalea sp. LPB0316]|uniref:MATE family efflux transporter n=1 Tax=Thalassotalea sp. LPB0316 TaxID=2769490 RepID=UPI0018690840|nr:MATE family efflux transporter [Thalassotalea sp. LPB0316]QOL26477.1 MATE family efflux transporter [Thalassotalea sp. LPB0316]
MSWLNTRSLKASFKLAWPISLQNTLVTLLGMVDVMMVSHLGDAAVAAVGLGNRIQFVVLVIIMGLSWGVGILVAQYWGAQQHEKIRRTVLMGSLIGVLAMLPIIFGFFYLADDVIAIGSNDAQVIALGQSYLWITMPSLCLIAVIMVLENALRSINQVRLPMALSTIAIAVNIVLNYWLINGGLGIEALGVDGAALATTISRAIHLMIFLYVLMRALHPVIPHSEDIKLLANPRPWWKLLKIVWPMMFSFGVWSLGTFVYQLIYGQMGTKELAVMSLLSPIEGMYISLFFGFASACAIMVGQKLGADKFDEAWSTARSFITLAPIVGLLLGALLYFAKHWVFIPFADLPVPTVDLASDVFLIICLGAWIKITNMTQAMGVLRAGGETKACLYIDIVGMWLISIPLTYYCAFVLQLPLFWVALATYSEEVAKAFLFFARVLQKKWMRNLANA